MQSGLIPLPKEWIDHSFVCILRNVYKDILVVSTLFNFSGATCLSSGSQAPKWELTILMGVVLLELVELMDPDA